MSFDGIQWTMTIYRHYHWTPKNNARVSPSFWSHFLLWSRSGSGSHAPYPRISTPSFKSLYRYAPMPVVSALYPTTLLYAPPLWNRFLNFTRYRSVDPKVKISIVIYGPYAVRTVRSLRVRVFKWDLTTKDKKMAPTIKLTYFGAAIHLPILSSSSNNSRNSIFCIRNSWIPTVLFHYSTEIPFSPCLWLQHNK